MVGRHEPIPPTFQVKILLQRLTNERHRLTVVRPDGSRLERELETRSVLLHDLVHYAVETQAGLADGFWGSLAGGMDFDALLLEAASPSQPGTALAEALVGPMQAVFQGRLEPERYVELAGARAPFVDQAFVDGVQRRLRRLWGHWRGTPFHGVLELPWPAEGGPTGPRSSGPG